MSTVPMLKLNKATAHIPIRADDSIDITAIRIGKQRIARKKDAKLSDLKQAILHSRVVITPEQAILESGVDAAREKNFSPYMDYPASEELDELAFSTLKELARLQAKGKDQPLEKQYKYKKYIVGFREVERAIRRAELKGVVVATNLEVVDQLECMVGKLYEECKKMEIPLVFALNRRKIGNALGKSMKQSLVGILSLDGVHQDWKRMLSLTDSLRNAITDGSLVQTPESHVII